MVIDPGSVAGKTPEATTLLISATAKPASSQTTTPSHPMLPLKTRNPEAPHPLPMSSRAKTRDPYPRSQRATSGSSNRAQTSSASAVSANAFSHQMKSALAIKEMHREAVSPSLHYSTPHVVIDPGSLAGMTPEATTLLISATAKPAPPQTTVPHTACLPSKPATLKAPHPLPVSSRAQTRDP